MGCHSHRALSLGRVISYDPRVMLQIVTPLIDDSRRIISDHNMFIVQATGGSGGI
jgi:hypothetical protein